MTNKLSDKGLKSKFDRSWFGRKLESLNERWFWKSIFIYVPTIYFSILPILENTLSFLSTDKISGIIIGIIVCIGGFAFVVASSYSTTDNSGKMQTLKKINKVANKKIVILERVIQAKSGISHNQYSYLLDYVDKSVMSEEFIHPFMNTTDPKRQLISIVKEINECVHLITSIPLNHIVTSIAYCFSDLDNEWLWADTSFLRRSSYTLNELIQNENSTFYEVYSEKTDYAFFNSKLQAINDGHYLKDQNDHSDGSILCREIPINLRNANIRIILSISTYNEKFSPCEENIENVKNTLGEVVLAPFEESIRIEMLNWYIKKSRELSINKPSQEI